MHLISMGIYNHSFKAARAEASPTGYSALYVTLAKFVSHFVCSSRYNWRAIHCRESRIRIHVAIPLRPISPILIPIDTPDIRQIRLNVPTFSFPRTRYRQWAMGAGIVRKSVCVSAKGSVRRNLSPNLAETPHKGRELYRQ